MTVFMTVIVAYSCGAANYTGGSNEMCLMWSSELTDLQEEYQDGLTIFVRSTPSDIEIYVGNANTEYSALSIKRTLL
ncbi:hypothetical protein SOVF_088540 isoform B [Spinacia oleracea]|nr:hypothetical protein SOVF_088540 isoform B [Spinacia oleracea]